MNRRLKIPRDLKNITRMKNRCLPGTAIDNRPSLEPCDLAVKGNEPETIAAPLTAKAVVPGSDIFDVDPELVSLPAIRIETLNIEKVTRDFRLRIVSQDIGFEGEGHERAFLGYST